MTENLLIFLWRALCELYSHQANCERGREQRKSLLQLLQAWRCSMWLLQISRGWKVCWFLELKATEIPVGVLLMMKFRYTTHAWYPPFLH